MMPARKACPCRPLCDLRDRLDLSIGRPGRARAADPRAEKRPGERRDIGDRPAAGIRLILADDPEGLPATVVSDDRHLAAEMDGVAIDCARLHLCGGPSRGPIANVTGCFSQ